MEIIKKYIYSASCILLLGGFVSCADILDEYATSAIDPNAINIGGIELDELSVSVDEPSQTRASGGTSQNAEEVGWLLDPLFGGIDIRIYPDNNQADKRIAILKLEKDNEDGGNTKENIKKSDEGLAVYSLNYRGGQSSTGTAKWQGNGRHHFEGVHVPAEIRYNEGESSTTHNKSLEDITKAGGTAPELTTNQSQAENYTLLEHYLSMPANWYHNATVERIKLPFKHRLARVLAYVLIDPKLAGVKIKGYKKDASGNTTPEEDATTTALRFCNVSVLNGVKEVNQTDGHERLYPQWIEARKVIPHFVEERASGTKDDSHFIMFYDKANKEYLFPPMESKWETAYNAWMAKYNSGEAGTKDEDKIKYADANSDYERTLYPGKVPVYDIIARPTYATDNDVMYDEEGESQTSSKKNKINFEIELENGLQYHKEFLFDLNANQQTIVYLRINAESVDYSSSGAEVWSNEKSDDGYYGVNNQNGNTLSFAGNSWQRAYRIGQKSWNVTDGHFYDKDEEDKYAQYVDEATWIEMLAEATEKGKHHGDYFILDQNITIDATKLPDNFVFTGHLDGQGHTITLKNTDHAWEQWFDATVSDYENESTTLYTEKNKSNFFVMPSSLFKHVHYDADYYKASDEDVEHVDAELYTYEEYKAIHALTEEEFAALPDEQKIKVPATHYQEDDVLPEGKQVGDIKTPAVYYELTEYNDTHPYKTNQEFESLSDEEKTKVAAHYQKKGTSTVIVPGVTIRTEERDEYPEATPTRAELLTAADGTYYTRSWEEGNYKYTPYKKPTHLYTEKDRHSGSSLFAGLNAIYDTKQETESSIYNQEWKWEANVHKEGDNWVPVKGYRAELLNIKLAEGGKFFPNDAIYTGNDLYKSGATVSGYIFNCWQGKKTIENVVPIPHY